MADSFVLLAALISVALIFDFLNAVALHGIPAFDFMVEELQPTVVSVVGVPFDARDLQADFVKLSGVACNVGQLLHCALRGSCVFSCLGLDGAKN